MIIKEVEKLHKYFFVFIFLLLAFLSYLLVSPFLVYIITALFLVYIFFPVHKRLIKIVKNETLSAWIMIVAVVTVIVLPLIIILNSIISEMVQFYNDFSTSGLDIWANYIPVNLQSSFSDLVTNGFNVLAGSVSGFLLSIPQILLGFVVIVFVMFFGFKSGEKLVEHTKKILPLDKKYKNQIFNKVKETMSGIVFGTIIIAVLQGVLATIGFWIFGAPAPFLWGLVVAIAGMLPFIGPNTIMVPMSIYVGLTDSWFKALGLFIYGIVLLTLVLDFLLKTKITSDKARIHPLVAFLGVIGGLMVFGLPGLFLGPIVLALFLLFIKFYVKQKV